MITTNWHTHTYLCKHADGDVDDYCAAAGDHGLEVLGFSDHAPLPDGRWGTVRMSLAELPEYVRLIDRARTRFPELRIYKGLECEYLPEFAAFYREKFLGEAGIEYLVGGAHWYPWQGEWVGIYGVVMTPAMLRAYTDYVIESIQSGLFQFIAHPDVFGNCYPTWDAEAAACSRAIIEAAMDQEVPLEINAYGLRKPPVETPDGVRPRYPWRPFWELAGEVGATVIVNSDAHRPQDIVAAMDRCIDIADSCGLRRIADFALQSVAS